MFPWLMIGIQILAAAAALHMLRWHVYPVLGTVRHGELIVDVWLPLAIVIPLMFLIGGIDGKFSEAGWPAVAGPVFCGAGALAIAAIIGRGGIGVFGEELVDGDAIGWRLAPRLTVAALIAGLVLLLLAAAHVMSMWVGHCAFAIAAVLLWINTPESGGDASSGGALQMKSGFGMLVVMVCAFAQGFAGRLVGEADRWLVVVTMLAYAAGALMLAARLTTAGLCARLGAWSAIFGVLFALGVASLIALVPRVLATVADVELPPHSMQIAAGFGAFAPEATILLVLVPAAAGLFRLPRILQRVVGVLLLAAVAARLAWWVAG